jgi:Domain of unknown function (DUF4278)
MILCYRGTYYCSHPQIIEKAETGMMAKYRGVSYQIQPQCLKTGSQREMNLKYRGVAYTVNQPVIEEGHRLVFPGYRF